MIVDNLILYLQFICLGTACLFSGFLYIGLGRREKCGSGEFVPVSVLVAARNEEDVILRLLESLKAQDYPHDLSQFVIIDDGSADRTASIVTEFCESDGRFKLIQLEDSPERSMGPKKRALTEGLKTAKGDIIITTDADCVVKAGWISGIVSCYDGDTAVVCGVVKYEKQKGFWARLAAFEGIIGAILNCAVINMGGALSSSGGNFSYRRSAFDDAGGFDTGGSSLSGDDDLLLQRIHRSGGKLRFNLSRETTVLTAGPTDSASYWKRKRRHLSAGKRYSAKWIALAAIIYLGCLLTVFQGGMYLAFSAADHRFLFGWGLFSLLLFVAFFRGTRRLGENGYLLFGVIGAIIFPVVFILIHILTLFPSPAWKGRRT